MQEGYTARKKKKKSRPYEQGMAFASISAKTNGRNVIIVAAARLTNGDGVVNIPKTKRKGCAGG